MYLKSSLPLFILILIFFLSACDRITELDNSDDGLPPAVPGSLAISYASDGLILLEWIGSSEPDLAGFNIYRSINDTSTFTKIFETKNDYYYDDSLDYNSFYYYKITAFDTKNRESEFTFIVSASPVNRSAPHKPRYFEINARNWIGDISIYLQWQPGSESDLAGYNIYKDINENFKPDTTNFISFTSVNFYTDKSTLELYKNYYYKVISVDKGGLKSEPSEELTDLIFQIPEIISPANDSLVDYFDNFIIKAIDKPARYKIILQTNEYFGEIWSKEITTNTVNDSVAILFDAGYIYSNRKYYWRVITYSNYSSEPNSISKLYSFILKP